MRALDSAILDTLRSGPADKGGLAKRTQRSPSQISAALTRLQGRGQVESFSDGSALMFRAVDR